jgi:hypothetical protein
MIGTCQRCKKYKTTLIAYRVKTYGRFSLFFLNDILIEGFPKNLDKIGRNGWTKKVHFMHFMHFSAISI